MEFEVTNIVFSNTDMHMEEIQVSSIQKNFPTKSVSILRQELHRRVKLEKYHHVQLDRSSQKFKEQTENGDRQPMEKKYLLLTLASVNNSPRPT